MALDKEKKKRGRKPKYVYDRVLARYQTGNYSIRELSKEFNIPRSTLAQFIKEKSVHKNTDAIKAVKSLTEGANALERLKEGAGEALKKNTDGSSPVKIVDNSLVVAEVIDIIKTKNPVFAKTLQSFSSKLLMRAFEMLEVADKPSDLNQLAGVIEKLNNTLQIIPKPPAIAQQFNFNKDEKEKQKTDIKKIVFEINKGSQDE